MSLYSTVLAGGAVAGQVVGGLLITANIAHLTWRPIFLVNVPVGIALIAAGRTVLPAARDAAAREASAERQVSTERRLDLPGLAVLTPAVFAFVLPLVLGQSLGWPPWGWALLAASVAAAFVLPLVESRVAQPILPGALFREPGISAGIGSLFGVMVVFGGWFFAMALQLQDRLGESPLRAGLTFAPAAGAFALVSLNWRRIPAVFHGALPVAGFALNAAGLAGIAVVSGTDNAGLYVFGAIAGAGMAAAFSPLMTRVLTRVPVAIAADATGVIVTVNQLALVVGVATFGTLYLNLGAHAAAITFGGLAVLAVAGGLMAAMHLARSRQPGSRR
jgi:hypothetical protein